MPINDPTKVTCVKVETSMATMHTDLQASLRATLVATDELLDISVIRQDNGNNVVVVYTYEDVSP